MKITNFRNMRRIDESIYVHRHFAEVDVRHWFRTTTRTVFREGMFWRFVDTGQFTPARDVERLSAAYEAQRELARVK